MIFDYLRVGDINKNQPVQIAILSVGDRVISAKIDNHSKYYTGAKEI